MSVRGSLLKYAAGGVFWSLVQVWVNRFFSLLLWAVMARLLVAEDLGIAATGLLILALIPNIAELGFGRAILQRPDLKDRDINLPFVVSVSICAAATLFVALNAGWITQLLNAENAALYLTFMLATLLLSVPNAFQRAILQREMKFKRLAGITIWSNVIGGVLAMIAAYFGAGYWSFLIQAYITVTVNTIWIWRYSRWVPRLDFDVASFREMFRFGLPLALQSLNTFFSRRLVDFIIIGKFGMAAYAGYALGSRVYKVATNLLQGALRDVSLTSLSRIADDRDRMAGVYLKTMSLLAYATVPVFVLGAAISLELTLVLFGPRWVEVAEISQILLILGAVHGVQYMNGPFNSARGQSAITLYTGLVRTAVTLAVLLLAPSDDMVDLAFYFAAAGIAVSPLPFYFAMRELRVGVGSVLRLLLPAAVLCGVAFAAVWFARPILVDLGLGLLLRTLVLVSLYLGVYAGLLAIVDRSKLALVLTTLRTTRRSVKQGDAGAE